MVAPTTKRRREEGGRTSTSNMREGGFGGGDRWDEGGLRATSRESMGPQTAQDGVRTDPKPRHSPKLPCPCMTGQT